MWVGGGKKTADQLTYSKSRKQRGGGGRREKAVTLLLNGSADKRMFKNADCSTKRRREIA